MVTESEEPQSLLLCDRLSRTGPFDAGVERRWEKSGDQRVLW